MKDELDGKIMTKFVGLRAKAQSYFIDDGSKEKKAKGTKKRLIRWKFRFENYKSCLEVTQLHNQINYLEKMKLRQIVLKKIIKNK